VESRCSNGPEQLTGFAAGHRDRIERILRAGRSGKTLLLT
jgi:hypothetical protein